MIAKDSTMVEDAPRRRGELAQRVRRLLDRLLGGGLGPQPVPVPIPGHRPRPAPDR
jgi:hypothetical protein